jgi:hypothetical protein
MRFIGMSGTLEQCCIIRPFMSGSLRLETLLGESEMELVARLVRLFFYVLTLSQVFNCFFMEETLAFLLIRTCNH